MKRPLLYVRNFTISSLQSRPSRTVVDGVMTIKCLFLRLLLL